jgi:hypothetical protein
VQENKESQNNVTEDQSNGESKSSAQQLYVDTSKDENEGAAVTEAQGEDDEQDDEDLDNILRKSGNEDKTPEPKITSS